jgi:hypothetical protein
METTSGSVAVGVRVANACDAGGSPTIFYCGSSYSVAVSPNPSTTDVSVALTSTDSEDANLESVKIVNEKGEVVAESDAKSKQVRFSVGTKRNLLCASFDSK